MNNCREMINNQEDGTISIYNSELGDIRNISSEVSKIEELSKQLKNGKMEVSVILESSNIKLQDYDTIKVIVEAHSNFVASNFF